MSSSRPLLLASLGISWGVIPEAFHFLPPGPEGFAAVHVLTTSSPVIDPGISQILDYFRSRFPTVPVRIDRVRQFEELRREEDHHLFNECLHRWMLDVAPDPTLRYVCLAGGLKTISAAVQQAASILGAAEVFHVLADPITSPTGSDRPRDPRTADEIDNALRLGAVHFVRLGAQPCWPQLRDLGSDAFPLLATPDPALPGVRSVHTPDQAFTRHLSDLRLRARNIAERWSDLADLPFAEIAAWSRAELDWLREPLQPDAAPDSVWIAALPKIDLHTHLGGFATHGPLLAQVRAAAQRPLAPASDLAAEPEPPPGWPIPHIPCGLDAYMKLGDATGSRLLADPGCLQEQCRLLYRHFLENGVIYAEVRCSPGNYATDSRSAWDVLQLIRSTFDACMEAAATPLGPACHVNLIIIATRRQKGDYRAAISRHLALAVTASEHHPDPDRCRVVGVDLAGFEDPTTRALYFREDFTAIHRRGIALTVHAGENDDAEGVWSAVFDLNARRIGHALHLVDAGELMRSVADRRIGVEMCPFANVQIKGFAPFHGSTPYPLRRYLDQGIPVSLNTDNIGISAASLTDNYLLAARLDPALTRLDILRLLRNALDTAFLSTAERRHLLSRIHLKLRPFAVS